MGGTEPTPEKKLKGARLATPSQIDGGNQGNRPRHDDAGHQLVDLLAGFAGGRVKCEHRRTEVLETSISYSLEHFARGERQTERLLVQFKAIASGWRNGMAHQGNLHTGNIA